jgi:hypothetical protein
MLNTIEAKKEEKAFQTSSYRISLNFFPKDFC